MSATVTDRLSPSDLSENQLRSLLRVVAGGARPKLIGVDGEQTELPDALYDLLVSVIESIRRKEAVFLMHESEAFTTQAAANFLGVSRQFLVRQLEEGKIPYHHVGTHRRIFFKDLVAYRQARSQARLAILDKMTADVVDSGLDDVVGDLARSD